MFILQNNFFGYPHLGRPNDYQQMTPMDAIFCDVETYEHITLIDDKNDMNNQSELITFLLNEIQPFFLDLQNQRLGEYARSNFKYKAKHEAKKSIRTGNNISPKTPFGDYVVKANADLDLQAGETIHLLPGTHIENGATAHLYIEELCYAPKSGNKSGNQQDTNSDENNSLKFSNTPVEETVFSVYPNPTDGTFYIDLKKNLSGKLTLYNLQGESLGQWEVSNGRKITLDDKTFINSIVIGLLLTSDNQLFRTKISLR